MTSCGGGDDDGGPRPTPAVVYDDLVEVREHAAALQNMLQGSSSVAAADAGELVKEMMGRLSSAMSVLGTSGVAASSSGAGRGPGARRRRSGTTAAADRLQGRRTSRRR
jgi:hypothetical protein